MPIDNAAARSRLADLIAAQTKEVEQTRALCASLAAANAADAAARMVGNHGPEGPHFNRYATSRARMYQTTVNTILKLRKALNRRYARPNRRQTTMPTPT